MKYSSIREVALHAAMVGDTKKAVDRLRMLSEPFRSAGFLGLADVLSWINQKTEAIKKLKLVSVDGLSIRMLTLEDMIAMLSKIEDESLRLEMSQSISSFKDRIDTMNPNSEHIPPNMPAFNLSLAYSALGDSYSNLGERSLAEDYFIRAGDLAVPFGGPQERDEMIKFVGQAMAKSRHFRLARYLANECISPSVRLHVYSAMIDAYGE